MIREPNKFSFLDRTFLLDILEILYKNMQSDKFFKMYPWSFFETNSQQNHP